MLCKDICRYIEKIYPLGLAEDWDNSGLLIGDYNQTINAILITLDINQKIIDEAVDKKVDMIISHHPLIFSPLKRIYYNSYEGKVIMDAIKNNICIYSAHTNFDIADNGMNDILCLKLNISKKENLKVLNYNKLKKFVVYVPKNYEYKVRDAIFKVGGGCIGNYSNCSFNIAGTGTFKPEKGTNPFIGHQGETEFVEETRIETVIENELLTEVIEAVKKSHPYEEVAYDIYPLDIKGKEIGLGRIGYLNNNIKYSDFLDCAKKALEINNLRYTGNLEDNVQKIAVCSGSGGDFVDECIIKKVDVFITGEIKYHQAQKANYNNLKIIQAGHFETENLFIDYIYNMLNNSCDNITIYKTEKNNCLFKFI